ncbi:MAG: MBL fold metallo-hydrolase [Patescibacteria group bacterium]|nr:MBL fold metallo-hydrolase [Patescibacteria group bacterium]
MVINHYGLGMIKIQQGELAVAFNPIDEVPKGRNDIKVVNFGADIALVSLNQPGYNGAARVARGDRALFLVNSPGEYEVGGTFIRGLPTAGPEGQNNTIYLLTIDQIRLVHLGALVDPKLPDDVTEKLGSVDVLFVPVGNGSLLNPKQAAQVVATLAPELVVPVDYDAKTLPIFLKEMGAEKEQPNESLTLKRKDLIGGSTRVNIIKSF